MNGEESRTVPGSQSRWEKAFQQFETPEEEIAKFTARLRQLGAREWHPESRIVELFCGRGNGLRALAGLGFKNLEGIDFSPGLLANYRGPARVRCGDCRDLPFAEASLDVVIVQGGLHHLFELPKDLDRTLRSVERVLCPGGRFVVVEPWRTLFLDAVHWIAFLPLARRWFPQLNAFAAMIEEERSTYEQWLGQPEMILGLLRERFRTELLRIAYGKVFFVGRRR